MQFSDFGQRFAQPSGISQLMEDLGEGIASNPDGCMLGGGNPAHIPVASTYFHQAMQDMLDQPGRYQSVVEKYCDPQGSGEFIEHIVHYLNKKFAWSISHKNVVITNGSQASFFGLFNFFAGQRTKQKKQILLPLTPEYIGYSDVGLEQNIFKGCQPEISLSDHDFFKYKVDFDQIEQHIQHAGALCFSRPTNPTGNVLSDSEVLQLDALAQQHDIPMIIDGAYGLPFPGIVFTQAMPIWHENIILCLSLSKLGLPGVRTGIVIAREEVVKTMKNLNAALNLSVGGLGQAIGSYLFEHNLIEKLSQDIIPPHYHQSAQSAIALIKHHMADLPVKIHEAQGALFLWLWMQDLPITSVELYQRLKKRGVFIIAGDYFFPGHDEPWQHKHECIRLSHAANPQKVEQGIMIIADELKTIYAQSKSTVSSI